MGLGEDVRFAVRLLLKDKWFTLVAAVALALGIGVNATVFTFVNAVLIRGLPIPDSDRVMAIGSTDRVRNRNLGVSYLDYRDWREASRSFDMLAFFNGTIGNLSDEGQPPERYNTSHVSSGTFQIMGQQPSLGRGFTPEDDRPGAPAVAVIGHTIWLNRYGSNPSVIGRAVRINDVPTTIIGVMPEGFRFPFNTDLWLPMGMVQGLQEQRRNARNWQVFGHLSPGVTREQAQSHLDAIRRHLLAADGARLFDRPFPYRGGLQQRFQRAETGTYFGREIGRAEAIAAIHAAAALSSAGVRSDVAPLACETFIPVAGRYMRPRPRRSAVPRSAPARPTAPPTPPTATPTSRPRSSSPIRRSAGSWRHGTKRVSCRSRPT